MSHPIHNNLFLDGNGVPLKFFVYDCEKKGNLEKLIKAGGGTVARDAPIGKNKGEEILCIVDSAGVLPSDDVPVLLSAEFVKDSARANKQVDMDVYRINPKQQTPKVTPSSGRTFYTESEEKEIIAILKEGGDLQEHYPKEVWLNLESRMVNRSWQSLRSRYKNYIFQKLPENQKSTPSSSTRSSTMFERKKRKMDSDDEEDEENGNESTANDEENEGETHQTTQQTNYTLEELFPEESSQSPPSSPKRTPKKTPKSALKSTQKTPKSNSGKQKITRDDDMNDGDEHNHNNKEKEDNTSGDEIVEELEGIVKELAKEEGVHSNVIWNLILMFNGEIEHVKGFLYQGKNYHIKPWTVKEDQILFGEDKQAIKQIKDTRGNQACMDRVSYLGEANLQNILKLK